MAEDRRHQEIVWELVKAKIKEGVDPGSISVSGIQNPSLERRCKLRGVNFDPEQKVDLIWPDSDEEK